MKVNGCVALLPQMLVDGRDHITVGGHQLPKEEAKVYFLLNKPRGYLCSTVGASRCKLVFDLFKGVSQRLFTAGRLDKDTTGLLIVTNDGVFSQRVIHPSSNIKKEYVAKTRQEITADHLKTIARGCEVEETFVKPISVKKVRKGTIKVVIAEGKKREVRCMLERAGLDVIELKRTRIGGLSLGNLPLGMWRLMTDKEKKLVFT